jgi:hypothetical protein
VEVFIILDLSAVRVWCTSLYHARFEHSYPSLLYWVSSVLGIGDCRPYLILLVMIIIIRLFGRECHPYCYSMDNKCAYCTYPLTIYSPKHSPHHDSSQTKQSPCAYGNMFSTTMSTTTKCKQMSPHTLVKSKHVGWSHAHRWRI